MTKENDFLIMNEDGSVTIKLVGSIDIGGAKVGFLTMREPTVNDQLVADKIKGTPADQEVGMFANLCDVSPSVLHALKLRNYKRLQVAYVDFMS